MSEIALEATVRNDFGKGFARRLRMAGQVPAVLYGHGTTPVHLALPAHELSLALKTKNALIKVAFDGRVELAVAKAVQRDPLRPVIKHVDLLLVRSGEKLTVDIPVVTTGEVPSDAVLSVEMAMLSVAAEATHLPSEVIVSVEGLTAGTHITAGHIVLPAGVELVTDPEATVVVVAASSASTAAAAESAE